jgi:large conductance mechanosensitive channel
MQWIKDFKAFALKGNVMDLAIGVIIGASFGKVISSLVGDVLMPFLGLILGKIDLSKLSITLKQAVGETPALLLSYGKFLQTVIDFVIIAFCVFLIISLLQRMKKKEKEIVKAPPALSEEVVLLGEIRDLLKKGMK